MGVLQGALPGNGGLHGVAGAPDIQAGHEAQAGHLFDGLVGGAVLAHTDGIVGEDPDRTGAHEGRQAQGVLGVIGEDHEGAGVGDETAVQGQAVHDGAHAELAHTVGQIVAGAGGGVEVHGMAGLGAHGARQVGRAAQHLGQVAHQFFQGLPGGHAGGDALAGFHGLLDHGGGDAGPVGRQVALHAAFQLGGQLGAGGAVGVETGLPFGFGLLAGFTGVPGGGDVVRHGERGLMPFQGGTGGGGHVHAQGRAVTGGGVGLGGTETDVGLADDEAGMLGVSAGFGQGGVQGPGIMAVHGADDLPAVGLVAGGHVFGEPAVDLAVDGDAVGVVQGDELAQAPHAGQGAGFVGHAFHEAAVTEEHVSVVVDDRVFGGVEAGGQHLFGQGHAHGGRDALTQGTGGHFHAGGHVAFGMAGGAGAQLAEVADVVHAQVVAGEVQHGIEQHGGVTVGQHEAVTIHPAGIGGIVFEAVAPEGFGHVGHAQGGAGMTGTGLLDGVDGKGADGVGTLSAGRHDAVLC